MGKTKAPSPQEIQKLRQQREQEEKAAYLPPGLINHGNTCFMNSVLQGLMATRLLADLTVFNPLPPSAHYTSYFYAPIASRRSPQLTNGHGVGGPDEKPWVDGMPLGDKFSQMMYSAWCMQEARRRDVLSPRIILSEIGRKYGQYLDFAQQDAHEFLVQLLDAMRMEELDIIKQRQPPPEKRSRKRPKPERVASAPAVPIATRPIAPTTISPQPSSSNPSTPDPSQNFFNFQPNGAGREPLVPFADMLFGGKLTSILVCQKCKHVSQTYEDFIDLSLPIKPEDYPRGRKRDVLKNLAKKLIQVNMPPGLQVARSSSVPPTPRREHGPGHDTVPVDDHRRRSLDHSIVSTEAPAIPKDPPRDNSINGDGGESSVPVEGEEVAQAKEESQDLGENQKDDKEKKERLKGEDSWSKLSRRISVTVGFGVGYRERSKDKRKSQDQERARYEGVTTKGDSVKDNVQNLGALDLDRPAPQQPEDARPPDAPEVLSPQPQPHPVLSPASQLTGRFANIQRPSLSRSNSKAPQPPKLSSQEAAYLRKLLADTLPANPFARFKPHVGHDSTQSLWLKLGQLPGVEECLRMFTAVEMLDGENRVGCRRCWKVANGLYKPKPRREVDATLEDSDSESEPEASSSPEPISNDASPTADTMNMHPEKIEPTVKDSPSSSSASVEVSDRASVSTGPTTLESGAPKIGLLPVTTEDMLHPGPRLPSNTTPGGFPIPVISTTEPTSPTRGPMSPLVEVESSLRAPPRWVKISPRIHKDYISDDSDGFDSETSVESESSGDGSRSHNPAVPHSAPLLSRHRNFSASSSSSGVPRSKQVVLRPAYKRYLIASAPPVLIIHLKRFQQITKAIPISFSHGFRKLDDYVAFPEYLDLGPFMAPRKEDFGLQENPKRGEFKPKEAEPCKYRLYAVVVHIGNILGGHYIAYVALPQRAPPSAPAEPMPASGENPAQNSQKTTSPPRQWAYVSDTNVRLTTLDEVLKARAYICMYERL